MSEYNDEIQDTGDTPILAEKSIMIADLTEEEARQLACEEGIICVEEDFEVEGCSENETNTLPDNIPEQWNLDVINAANQQYKLGNDTVKIAIMDSGITIDSQYSVEERINFVPGDDGLEPLYDDLSGHGTSIASIIGSKDDGEKLTGINPNAELYSLKVLDIDKKGTASRVIEGIYWCINNGIDIINMSFGTLNNSKALEMAIQDAQKAGILMVSAAGNGTDIEYPAKYDEVIAVGSLNTEGLKSEKSSSGNEMELVAPGEYIPALDWLGNPILVDGTSVAAAQVTGIASVLWSLDKNMSSGFIRNLLTASANETGNTSDYGNGIIDLDYALSIYDDYKNLYSSDENISNINLFDNKNEVPVYDESIIEASWSINNHKDAIDNNGLSAEAARIIKLGVAFPDNYKFGLDQQNKTGPFHGFRNYVANYVYLAKIARKCYTSGMSEALKVPYPISTSGSGNLATAAKKAQSDMLEYLNMVNTNPIWRSLLNDKITQENQGRILIGFAIHTAMDAYAHQSYKPDKTHIKDSNKRDDDEFVPLRYDTAKAVASSIINSWHNTHTFNAMQFKQDKIHTKGAFYLRNFSTRVKNTDPSTWSSNSTWFNDRTVDEDDSNISEN